MWKLQKNRIQLNDSLEVLLEHFFHFSGRCGGAKAFHDMSISIDDEFSEIPFDGVKQGASLLSLQESVQGVFAVTIYIDFAEHIEFDALILSELVDFLIVFGLLIERVWWEGENSQTCNYN